MYSDVCVNCPIQEYSIVLLLNVIVPMILAFLKNCCKVAKLKDDIININRVSVYQTKIRIGD